MSADTLTAFDDNSPHRASVLRELFDPVYYRAQSGCTLAPDKLCAHFIETGDAAGFSPTPYFSTTWYKERYPAWAHCGARTAFDDFLFQLNLGEERQPHPLINPVFYRAAYPDLQGFGAAAALHFMRHGDCENRRPSAEFDANFYRTCYLPLGARYSFRHYITEGASAGFLPHPVLRNALDSSLAMRSATAETPRPILLAAHDAQMAGVPLLTLDLADALSQRGWDPVFLLGKAGPLLPRFHAPGPVFIMAEGWDVSGLAAALPPGTPAVINTAAAASLAAPLTEVGLNCLVLIHEMADFIHEHGLLQDLKAARLAGAGIIASMPPTQRALSDDLPGLEHIRPGIVLPQTQIGAFRSRRQTGAGGPLFIGAGHADRRKGFDLFLAAAAAICARAPAARFVWLGALDPWARGLANAALAAGLDLTLPGFVQDSLAWYRAADVYLLTSRQDPGPTTAIHAAAVGTPFVGYAADIGMIGMTGGVGHFVAPGDQAGFVETALSLAAHISPVSRHRLRRHIRAETGFATYVDALLSRLSHGQADAV